jgi:hypothetical protein
MLNGQPTLGDFGLVDFPGKPEITDRMEILGPRFYIAPFLSHTGRTTNNRACANAKRIRRSSAIEDTRCFDVYRNSAQPNCAHFYVHLARRA